MKSLITKIALGLFAVAVIAFGSNVSTVKAAPGFAITSISASCNGTGQVSYTGSIPQGGFTLELKDKASDNSGSFISTNPPTIITITSGASPVSYALSLAHWSAPHLRVDSNFSTKSDSLNCDALPTPTPTSTPTPTATPTLTPTPTTDPCANNACVTPTITPTPTTVSCPNGQQNQNGVCINIDCNGGGTCEVIIGDTPTPTVTPVVTDAPTGAPTATPTNTPSNNNGDNNNTNNNNGTTSSSSETHVQAVLGATTMAATGTFETDVMNLMLLSGTLLLAFGSLSYAKEKRA